jgi:hypothetical protein
MIFKDEILKEMLRITEEPLTKEAHSGLKINESQFSLIDTPTDELKAISLPLIQNVVFAVDYDGQDKELLKEKKRAIEVEDIVEQAHPETAYMADGPYGTGVVENQNQQHTKIKNTIFKMPTGFHFNTFADYVEGLTKLANHLEAKGKTEAAKKVDETLSFFFQKRADTTKEVGLKPPTRRLLDPSGPAYFGDRPPPPGPPRTPTPYISKDLDLIEQRKAPGYGQVKTWTDKPGPKPRVPGLETLKPTVVMSPEKAKKVQEELRRIKEGPESKKPFKEPSPGAPEKTKRKPGSFTGREIEVDKLVPEKPDKPSKPGRKFPGAAWLSKLPAWLTGLGKGGKAGLIAGIAAATGAAIYGLWRAFKDDWDSAIEAAKEAATAGKHPAAQQLVAELERQGNAIKAQGKDLDESDSTAFAALASGVGQLAKLAPGISEEMVEASSRLSKIISGLGKEVEGYINKTTGKKAGPITEKIESLQRWFKERDPEVRVTGEIDRRLTQHVEKFVSNMRKRFGPKWTAMTEDKFNTNFILNNYSYDEIDKAYEIWKAPHRFYKGTEERKPIKYQERV